MASTKRLPSGERREQILAEALNLFSTRGIFEVSTRDIALATGISQPSLYAHFKGRDEIVIELSRRAFVRLRERMIAARSSQDSPLDQLRAMGHEYICFGLQESDAYRVAFMIERATLAPIDQAAIHETALHGFQIVHDFFKEHQKGDPAHIVAMAQSAWASLHGLVSLMLARPAFPWADKDRLIELQLDQLCSQAIN